MTRDQIKQAQTMLNALGFNSGTPDGIVGPMTKSATTAFQRTYGLTADGIIGPITFSKLTEIYNQRAKTGVVSSPVPSISTKPAQQTIITTTAMPVAKKPFMTNKNLMIIAVGVVALGMLIPLMKMKPRL